MIADNILGTFCIQHMAELIKKKPAQTEGETFARASPFFALDFL
jgi:hypothetical protein